MDVVRSCIEKGRQAVLDEAIRDISDMDPLVTSSMVQKSLPETGYFTAETSAEKVEAHFRT